MVDYPREAWQKPSRPITGPAPKQKTTLGVCHWDGDDVPNGDPVTYLQKMQDSYVTSRGYSIGYWQYITRNGDAWQIRGPYGNSKVYNSAANKGEKVAGNANDWTYPILFEARFNDFLTDAQMATARRLWAEYGITARPIPHSEIDYTACCGDNIRSQIALGHLDPGGTAPPPQPPPEEGENVIVNLVKHKDHVAVYAQYSGGYKTWIPDGNVLNVYQFISGMKPQTMPDNAWMTATGPIVGPVPAGVDEWGIPN